MESRRHRPVAGAPDARWPHRPPLVLVAAHVAETAQTADDLFGNVMDLQRRTLATLREPTNSMCPASAFERFNGHAMVTDVNVTPAFARSKRSACSRRVLGLRSMFLSAIHVTGGAWLGEPPWVLWRLGGLDLLRPR